ncbi:transcriptional regulator family: Fungal Specific TF [Penicillium fimorum]|uniref:Transcriptional regulator family: Fungal Specific TF n=1 Tax=Penicillium fimorum TaxID=1882269 RepID=A0A9W9Y2N6_9EURO|nr:transcriptional regulator family: Fungal Specific TF [Penicillium fimorum]
MASTSVDAIAPSQLLHYLPTYRALICLRCSYAIQPGAVARHLKEIHYLHHPSRQAFVDYASGFELNQPNDVVLPDETQFPVPLLPVQNGLASFFAAGCTHLSATTKRMKQDWMSVHRISASDNGGFWDPVPLQSFFRGNALDTLDGLYLSALSGQNWDRDV